MLFWEVTGIAEVSSTSISALSYALMLLKSSVLIKFWQRFNRDKTSLAALSDSRISSISQVSKFSLLNSWPMHLD